MTYSVTLQTFYHERPVCRTFETKEEAEEFIEAQKQRWEHEVLAGWKVAPKIEVGQ